MGHIGQLPTLFINLRKTTMSSVLNALRTRISAASVAVINASEIAEFANTTPINAFDIHADLHNVFNKSVDPVFYADVTSRLAWYLDTQIVNKLKSVALAIPPHVGTPTIDSVAEVNMELDSMRHAAENFEEAGSSSISNLEMITTMLNIRESWLTHAAESASKNRPYEEKSIESQIAVPRKQTVPKGYFADALTDALEAVHLTDLTSRTALSVAINAANSVDLCERNIRELNSKLTPEQQEALFDLVISPTEVVSTTLADGTISKRLIARTLTPTESAIAERHDLLEQLSALSVPIAEALSIYLEDIATEQSKYDNYYAADLARIPVMLQALEYCKKGMLSPGEHLGDFHTLPAQLQVDACSNAIAALERTLVRFKGKGYTYRQYKQVVEAAVDLLNRVILERYED